MTLHVLFCHAVHRRRRETHRTEEDFTHKLCTPRAQSISKSANVFSAKTHAKAACLISSATVMRSCLRCHLYNKMGIPEDRRRKPTAGLVATSKQKGRMNGNGSVETMGGYTRHENTKEATVIQNAGGRKGGRSVCTSGRSMLDLGN